VNIKYRRFLPPAILVIILDQITKIIVLAQVAKGEVIPVIPGFFNIVHVWNRGAAFGFLSSSEHSWLPIFFSVTVLIALFILWRMAAGEFNSSAWRGVSLGLIAGGAVGNLIDRLYLGHVVDFLDVLLGNYHWPAFNIADSGISVGTVILLYILLFKDKAHTTPEASQESVDATSGDAASDRE
jgi:signal peptidase II